MTRRTQSRKKFVRGRAGGLAVSKDRAHMAAIGRKGAARTNEILAQRRAQVRDRFWLDMQEAERRQQMELIPLGSLVEQ
jgi:general stress protein YciG